MNQPRIRLGQEAWWPDQAAKAVADYDKLVARVSQIANDDARKTILDWIGRSDLPGSPAERYQVVSTALASGVPADQMLQDRVSQLRAAVASLTAKVDSAETAYGTLSAVKAAGSTSEADVRGLVITGSIALLGLIIAPLLLD